MPNSPTSRRSLPPTRHATLRSPAAFAFATSVALAGTVAHAGGEVTAVETSETPATPSGYTVDGTAFEWGQGANLVLEAFVTGGERHLPLGTADRTEIRRIDRAGVATGTPCGVFAETLDPSGTRLAPDFPALPDGNCDTAALLASDLLNRGALDLFSNQSPTAKNVERVDFVHEAGLNAPFDPSAGALAGHLVGDKSGNNGVQMAAILALDGDGLPSAYGSLVRVGVFRCPDSELCYGSTGLTHDYAFLQSESLPPPGAPAPFSSFTEPVGLAYVSADALGLDAGQRYHGVSLFAEDVDAAVHDLLDPSTFPADTVDGSRGVAGDSVDLYGGSARRYVAEAANVASGRAACTVPGGTRAVGVPGIDVAVLTDAAGDGVVDPNADAPLGAAVASGADGEFAAPALADGSYFLRIDAGDPDLPVGASVASAETLPFVVAGNDVDSLDFLLDCPDLAAPPTAVADTVTLVQEAPEAPVPETPIDVLGNDLDPLGQGLSVIAVEQAARGEVRIADDGSGVLYTPEPGFDGDDAFGYTLEDAAGRRDGTIVSVSVELAEGDDPACADGGRVDGCTILTELDGHGLGALRGVSLLALLAVLIGRAGRRPSRSLGRPLDRASGGERS